MKRGQLVLTYQRGYFALIAVTKSEADGQFGGVVVASNIQQFPKGAKSSRWEAKYFNPVNMLDVTTVDGELTMDFAGNAFNWKEAEKKEPVVNKPRPQVKRPKPKATTRRIPPELLGLLLYGMMLGEPQGKQRVKPGVKKL